MFKCTLRIESKYKKLSLEDGISFKESTTLFSKLVRCFENENVHFTLIGIANTSYAPVLATDEKQDVIKFKNIHKKIGTSDYYDLTPSEQDYADSLNELLFEKGIYIQALNDDDNEPIEITA